MKKSYIIGLAVAGVCAATLVMTNAQTPSALESKATIESENPLMPPSNTPAREPEKSQILPGDIKVKVLEREATDAERLIEAKLWEFNVQMPNDGSSFVSDLELWRNDKLVRRLTGSAVGPSLSPTKSEPYHLLVGLYPPGGSWEDGKMKVVSALKMPSGVGGTAPHIVDFPVAQGGFISSRAEYDKKQKAFLLMIIGNNKKTNVTWPLPQRDDYALYLRISKKHYRTP